MASYPTVLSVLLRHHACHSWF